MQKLRATTAIVSALSLFVTQSTAYALPQGGQVSGGTASITSGANQMDINQSSQRAILDWNSFNISNGETVNFNQPNSGAVSLNRIHDANPSQINGSLNANGQVWLVNSQGIAFGGNAQVNVGGLLATTSDISNNSFMSGGSVFNIVGNPLAWIKNAGHIHIHDGGVAALAGPNVSNSGTIVADMGSVHLASGDVVSLDLNGDGLISIAASDAVIDQMVDNSGSISAPGGHVFISAATASNAVNSLVNMSGNITAHDVTIDSGSKGTTLVSGHIDATGNKGGNVDVLGKNVGILSGAMIDASGAAGGGTIRVGGDAHGAGATRTATRTIVQGSTNLYTNATQDGDGGKTIVWANDRTDFAGNIEAKGAGNGNGGFVETSGKQTLSATGNVNASAPHGNAGTWLLDPNNVLIGAAATGGNVSAGPNFTTTDDSAIVTTASIQAALNAGTSVTITTGTSGTNAQAGDITIVSDITKSAGAGAALTLNAANDIIVNSGVAISSSSSVLNVIFDSDFDQSGAGAILMNSGSSITTNGGSVQFGGGGTPASYASRGDAANIYGIRISGASINAGGGVINMYGQGYAGAGNSNYGLYIDSASTLQTSGTGGIHLSGNGGGDGGNSGNNSGIVLSGAGTNVTAVDGTIVIGGTAAVNGGNINSDINIGIDLGAGTTVQTTGFGMIVMGGVGGNTAGGYMNRGIQVSGTVQTNTGSINMSGQSGNGGLDTNDMDNHGIQIAGNITSTGGTIISVAGYGGNGVGNYNFGVEMAGGHITNNGGIIALVGNGGGSGTGLYDIGIGMRNGATISDTGGGLIVLVGTGGYGTGGGNNGIQMPSGAGTASISTTGAGSISLTGTGGTGGIGMYLGNFTDLLHASGTGDINITADTMAYTAAADLFHANGGNINIKTRTSGTTMGIGAGAGTLQLDDTLLGSLTYGGTLTLGDSTTAAMDINSAYTFTKPVVFQNKAGSDITLHHALNSTSAGNAITIASGRNFINQAGAAALTAAPGRWLVYSTDPVQDTLQGLTPAFTHFSGTYAGYGPSAVTEGGNGFIYSAAGAGLGGGGSGPVTIPTVVDGYIHENIWMFGQMRAGDNNSGFRQLADATGGLFHFKTDTGRILPPSPVSFDTSGGIPVGGLQTTEQPE